MEGERQRAGAWGSAGDGLGKDGSGGEGYWMGRVVGRGKGADGGWGQPPYERG